MSDCDVANEIAEEHASKGERLVVLEPAVDDGTVVKTAGTLFFNVLEAFDLPRTESHGGLLGYDRQDLYLSVGLQTERGRESEKSTRVHEGRDGTVRWDDETISIEYSNAGDAVTAEVWNQNPGSDVIIGKATVTKRHVRALALLQDRCARIRLPLSRQRPSGRVETRGVLVARIRLVLDTDDPRSTVTPNLRRSSLGRSPRGAEGAGREKKEAGISDVTTGYLVCSGLTAYDLPRTEGLKFGGSQAPYVKITLGSIAERSRSVAGGIHMCEWTCQPLRWRVDLSHAEHHVLSRGFVVEVWNENQSHRDALIGKGFVRPEMLNQLQQHPGNGGVSCRVKLSRQGKGRQGTVSMVLSFEPDQPGDATLLKEHLSPQEVGASLQPEYDSNVVVITNLIATDLSDIMAFGFGALDKVEPYVVARVGVTERTTPTTAVVRGTSTWADTCFTFPLVDKPCGGASILRLELWTSNAVQDDQVGYVEVNLATLSFDQRKTQDLQKAFTSSKSQVQLDFKLCLIDAGGDNYGDIHPGTISCTVERRPRNDDGDELADTSGILQRKRSDSTQPPWTGITLPSIGSTEGPGILKVMVLDTILHEEVEAPEIRMTLFPGKRFAITRPLLEIGGASSPEDGPESSVTGAWNEELHIPCYSIDFDELGSGVTLQADVVVVGALAGQRLLGRGRVDISDAIQTRKERAITLDIASDDRGGASHVVGKLNICIRFVDAWAAFQTDLPGQSETPSVPRQGVGYLHSPGVLRVFVVEARELSGLQRDQDPYVVVERKAADPTIACHARPFSSAVATVGAGKEARWLESCDLRVGQAEADFLRSQPGGGSITFTVTLTDRDVRGGDESISSLEVVVTPETLTERESSVLWHRLFFQGRDRGFVRLGCCWIPADLEPVSTCCLRPEERVESGTLYLWLKEGRDLVNPTPTAQRIRGLPPTCEMELRPYAKVGRKKARDVLGCARVRESNNQDLDSGVFHKFLKMDFAEIIQSQDRNLADASPTFLVSVYTRVGEKKIVSGRAEILLASLCGYKNLSGEAVCRHPHYRGGAVGNCNATAKQNHNTSAKGTRHSVFRGSSKDRVLDFDDAEARSCPVAAVDKVIPLHEDRGSTYDDTKGHGDHTRAGGRGGELSLRALYVPDRLADAMGVRSAIKALSRAAEDSMQHFTEHASVALPRAVDDWVSAGSDSQTLNFDEMVLPGALEVYLIRAADLELRDETVVPVVQLRLLCSAGAELNTSEIGRRSEAGVEWNHQFSMLVDDANLEMLEILILDGSASQACQRPLACCKIPLRRYAQNYHASQVVDVGQVPPERFKLTDHRGSGFQGHIILSLNFLPEVVGQTRILREAFAPTNNLLPAPVKTAPRRPAATVSTAAEKSAIHILIVCMDGGDVSREDRVRVRVSLAEDSDDWTGRERFVGANSAGAISGVGVVDEEAAVCRWHTPGKATAEASGEDVSPMAASGELLTLLWDPSVPPLAWGRGRASVLKFEISRGPGRPAEWTGFVPTAGLVHSPRSVFERAIHLTGRVGSEPPTFARTMASTGRADDRRGVSLEVAMVFQPTISSGSGRGGSVAGMAQRDVNITAEKRHKSDLAQSPFHPDVRRIPCEAGELVAHCLRARNLRSSRTEEWEQRDAHPEVHLTAVPDGGEVATSTPYMEPGGRHPVWGQTRTLSIADAVTAWVVIRIRDAGQLVGDNVMGEVELSVAGIIAAEHGVAAASLRDTSNRHLEHPQDESSSVESAGRAASPRQKHIGVPGRAEKIASKKKRRFSTNEVADTELPESTRRLNPDNIKPRGVEAWFPVFVSSRQGGSRERELVGEVRLSFRFLSADFMQQRELTAGVDEGDNGPVGALRYKLERRPGRLFFTVRCGRTLPKAMIGERAPVVEARLRHGGWKCSTRRQIGLNPTFNENMAVEILWTPQDLHSPELILELKDKALGGGLMAAIRVAVAPFILHPFMPADIWCPMLRDGAVGNTSAGLYCGFVYIPSAGGKQQGDCHSSTRESSGTNPAINSIENVADPEYSGVLRRAWSGMVHVQVLSARGLPASSKDPQVGVRLRVGGHLGGPSPPFQWTAIALGGKGDPQFNSTFLLGLRQEALMGLEDQAKPVVLGRTPVLEVEARCSRGKGKLLGTVELPIFPLWFMGHMTRAWYPMRSSDGESEAGRVFLGLQFVADGGGTGITALTATATNGGTGEAAGRRRYLFLEVRQGRDLRLAPALSSHPVVHVEMLGSGSRGKSPPSKNGGTDPEWPDGAGLLALPYPTSGICKGSLAYSNEVLRISVFNERGKENGGQEDNGGAWGENAGNPLVGQCDWPLPAEDLALGHPISCWHGLWMGGTPAGAVYLRCRVGFEGEALDHTPPYESPNGTSGGNLAVPPRAFGNYHVEFLKVQGFERTLRRMGLAFENSLAGSSQQSSELQWDGVAYLTDAPGCGGDDSPACGAASAPVASGWAVAVGAMGYGSSRSLCVQVSMAGGLLNNGGAKGGNRAIKAVSYVPPEKLVPIVAVPGSQLLEWFPSVEVRDEIVGDKGRVGEADTGQVLLSVRYAPLAVGILEVAVCEAQLLDNDQSPTIESGNFKALTRVLPAQTGGRTGHKVRSTPGRRGVRTNLHGDGGRYTCPNRGTILSWEDTTPHRIRFNNAFNKQPTTLHVSVVQSDRMIGFASVGVEAIVHDVMSTMAREITEGDRRPRGSAHDLGPVGLCDNDFGDPVQAWYPLHAPVKLSRLKASEGGAPSTEEGDHLPAPPAASTEVGRVRVEIKFAPHPKVLVRNWQEGNAVTRANGIAAMKALFYRLNRSGNLVVETEDLRLALIGAVDAFLTKPSTATQAENEAPGDTTRASQAGEFVLLMSQRFKPNLASGRGVALSESAANSVLTMVERDRNAEVTFTEFCVFLSQAAAWQTKAGVGDLVSELAEDNGDDCGDNDSEYGSVGSDADENARGPVVGGRHHRHSEVRGGHDSCAVSLVQPSLQLPNPIDIDNNPPMDCKLERTGRSAIKYGGGTTRKNKELNGQELARSPTTDRAKQCAVTRLTLKQENPPNASDSYGTVEIDRGIDEPAQTTAGHKKEDSAGKRRFPKDVTSWTMDQVQNWLSEDMQLPKHIDVFREASIDGLVLCNLTDTLLKEGMGIPDPLHRLKILSHVKKLCKHQHQHDDHMRNDNVTLTPTPQDHVYSAARKPFSPPFRSNGIDVVETRSPPPVTLPEENALSRPLTGSLPHNVGPGHLRKQETEHVMQRTGFVGKDDHVPVGLLSGVTAGEEAFALTMNEVRGEFLADERLGQSATGRSPLRKRKRRLPANATTSEVHEVVQKAMWEAAALLVEKQPTENVPHRRVKNTDEYPSAWWGSSEGGSTSKSDSVNHGEIGQGWYSDNNAETRELGTQKQARLLFDDFCSCQQGARKSPLTDYSLKLTRHKLEVCIRSFLQIEMRWEQWQLFLDSIASLRTQGYLSPDEFSKEFAFHSLNHPETPTGSIEFEADSTGSSSSAAENATEWGTMVTQDIAKVREFVLGIADTLRTNRQTLRSVISKFDRRRGEKVSVSEFVDLVKVLTGKTGSPGRARATIDAFDRKQAYNLLRCVDKDGDRRVVLRDLVVFVFATWTEELNRLVIPKGGGEDLRQRRRQLQKDLRRHFPANFRRALNLDEVKPETVNHDPFSALLTRLGLETPSPPSPRLQPTFASPQRCHRRNRSARSSSHDDGGFEAGRSSHSGDLVVVEAQERQRHIGRQGRHLSTSMPTRPSREHRPATSGGRGRSELTGSEGRKELKRYSSFETKRMLSLPPRVDLSAVTLTASHNRELLAQGAFNTSGEDERPFQGSSSRGRHFKEV